MTNWRIRCELRLDRTDAGVIGMPPTRLSWNTWKVCVRNRASELATKPRARQACARNGRSGARRLRAGERSCARARTPSGQRRSGHGGGGRPAGANTPVTAPAAPAAPARTVPPAGRSRSPNPSPELPGLDYPSSIFVSNRALQVLAGEPVERLEVDVERRPPAGVCTASTAAESPPLQPRSTNSPYPTPRAPWPPLRTRQGEPFVSL